MSAKEGNSGILNGIRVRFSMLLNWLRPHVPKPATDLLDPFATFHEWSSDADEEAYRTL